MEEYTEMEPCLGDVDREALLPELPGGGLQAGHELDGADQAEVTGAIQVGLDALYEVEAVQLDVNKDVEHLDVGRLVHRDEAAVAVVDHEVAAEGPS